MATYFLDTSAIIKRYIFEQGQAWILSLFNPAQGHNLYISQLALVEVVAAICRRAREQSISMAERDRLITVFRQDGKESYNIWLVDTELYNSADDLCRSHSLRAYDGGTTRWRTCTTSLHVRPNMTAYLIESPLPSFRIL